MRFWRLTLLTCLVTGLSGCDLAPKYQVPTVAVPPSFKEDVRPVTFKGGSWQHAQPQDVLPRGAWWELYNDPELNRLEQMVAVNNQTFAGALAVYDQARAF